ncbi:MAG: hypothetical protein K2K72_03350, partial [Duncaniella sp.]|nr:hypothetical protein [Duncaniella sp.]
LHSTACLVWISPEYSRRYPHRVAALRANTGEPFTTKAIFHSVLEGAGISTPVCDPEKSLFKTPSQR